MLSLLIACNNDGSSKNELDDTSEAYKTTLLAAITNNSFAALPGSYDTATYNFSESNPASIASCTFVFDCTVVDASATAFRTVTDVEGTITYSYEATVPSVQKTITTIARLKSSLENIVDNNDVEQIELFYKVDLYYGTISYYKITYDTGDIFYISTDLPIYANPVAEAYLQNDDTYFVYYLSNYSFFVSTP